MATDFRGDGSIRRALEENVCDYYALSSNQENIGTVVTKEGLSKKELGFGDFKTTVLRFVNMQVTMADNAGVIAYGSQKLYDFPQGYVYIQSAVADLALTKTSGGVIDTWDGDIAVGTAAADNTNTLSGTEANIIPSTSTPQAVAGATTGDGVSTATQHAILDGTSSAIDLYINLLVDDTDHDVTTTPCNLILNGTLRLNWVFMGDN